MWHDGFRVQELIVSGSERIVSTAQATGSTGTGTYTHRTDASEEVEQIDDLASKRRTREMQQIREQGNTCGSGCCCSLASSASLSLSPSPSRLLLYCRQYMFARHAVRRSTCVPCLSKGKWLREAERKKDYSSSQIGCRDSGREALNYLTMSSCGLDSGASVKGRVGECGWVSE